MGASVGGAVCFSDARAEEKSVSWIEVGTDVGGRRTEKSGGGNGGGGGGGAGAGAEGANVVDRLDN